MHALSIPAFCRCLVTSVSQYCLSDAAYMCPEHQILVLNISYGHCQRTNPGICAGIANLDNCLNRRPQNSNWRTRTEYTDQSLAEEESPRLVGIIGYFHLLEPAAKVAQAHVRTREMP